MDWGQQRPPKEITEALRSAANLVLCRGRVLWQRPELALAPRLTQSWLEMFCSASCILREMQRPVANVAAVVRGLKDVMAFAHSAWVAVLSDPRGSPPFSVAISSPFVPFKTLLGEILSLLRDSLALWQLYAPRHAIAVNWMYLCAHASFRTSTVFHEMLQQRRPPSWMRFAQVLQLVIADLQRTTLLAGYMPSLATRTVVKSFAQPPLAPWCSEPGLLITWTASKAKITEVMQLVRASGPVAQLAIDAFFGK